MEALARSVALAGHNHDVLVAALTGAQEVVRAPRQLSWERCAPWAPEPLTRSDQAVLEATAKAGSLYDHLPPRVHKVTSAHPLLGTFIRAARVTTDTRATRHRARLLAAGHLPAVWGPPPPVRALRRLVAQRQRLVRPRTQAAKRWHSVRPAHPLAPPAGRLGSSASPAWGEQRALPALARLRAPQDRTLLQTGARRIAAGDAAVTRLRTPDPWRARAPCLRQVPGCAVVTSMTVLAARGDRTRLPSAKQRVGERGWGASVPAAGQTYPTGPLTQQGRRERRTVLVAAAGSAVTHPPFCKAPVARLVPAVGKGQALVARARTLLVVVWHVLTQQAADRHADRPLVTRQRQRWGASHGLATSAGLSRGPLAQQVWDRRGRGGGAMLVVPAGAGT